MEHMRTVLLELELLFLLYVSGRLHRVHKSSCTVRIIAYISGY